MGKMWIAGRAVPPRPLPGPPFTLLEGATPPADADQANVWIVDGLGAYVRLTPYTDPTCSSPPCADEMHSPRLNPSGTQVAYCDFEPTSPFGMALWVVPTDGSATYPLTPLWSDGGNGSWANHPSWKADGSKILFTYAGPDGGSYVGGTFGGRILEVTYPGAVATNLWTPDIQTPQREEGAHPCYSPDGTMIAFLVNIANGGGGNLSRQGLWVMNADGSSPTLLDNWDNGSSNDGWQLSGTQIAWSNDSQWIAYVAAGFTAASGDGAVYKIKPDGTSKTMLAAGDTVGVTYHLGWGAWVEDDSAVIANAVATGGGTAGIYSCPSDGSGESLILANSPNGVAGGQNFQSVYGWNGRYYWTNKKSPNAVVLKSCLPDGTDLQTYFTTPDAVVASGSGFEWL